MSRGTSTLKRSGPIKSKAPMSRGVAQLGRSGKLAPKPGKARAKPMKSGKVPPNAAEKEWMGKVAELGCIVCRQQGRGFVPCAVHHIVEGGRRLGHLFTLGLCQPGHHMDSPDKSQISRHPNKARFTAAYGSEYELLWITKQLLGEF